MKKITTLIFIFLSLTLSAKKEPQEKAFLGVGFQLINTTQFKVKSAGFGYLITRVLQNTAADIIGLEVGDIIIGLDKEDFTKIIKKDRQGFLSKTIKSKQMGVSLTLKVVRQETTILKNKKTIKDIKTIKNLIDNQSDGSKINFSIEKQSKILTLTAILGTRANIDKKDVIKNSQMFPKYKNITSTYTDLFLKTIKEKKLTSDYEDLLERYKKNELWDDGFRLNLFRYLHREPLKLIPIMDDVLNKFEITIKNNHKAIINLATKHLDITQTFKTKILPKTQLISFIKNTLNQAEFLRKEAFNGLTKKELNFLTQQTPLLLKRFEKSFYIDRAKEKKDKENNIKVIKLSKKIDFSKLFKASHLLLSLTDKQFLMQLKQTIKNEDITFNTTAGEVFIGGFKNNIYHKKYALIIDFSGNDRYEKEVSRVVNGISLIIDFEGNDEYQHTRPYAQGSAFMGVGILLDMSGNDTYIAKSYAQGFSLFGVGLLIDSQGNDRYFANHLSQAVAFWGIGALIDKNGQDNYQLNLLGQGLGGVKGFASLLDFQGDDKYFATGEAESSYRVSGVFEGTAQGVGIGFRGYASGGIGLLLDGQGQDEFRAGNFSQGVGYFYGLGILKNSGNGNDSYRSSRYSQGASAHSAIGLLIDDGGNDSYFSMSGVSQSAAWDLALAGLWDKSGNDVYIGSPAFSSQNGFSFFIDSFGTDKYSSVAGGQSNDYHGGVSFGIFMDNGGTIDTYPTHLQNSTQTLNRKYGLFFDK